MNWIKRLYHTVFDRPCPGCAEVNMPFGRRCSFCDEFDTPIHKTEEQ